MNACVLLIGYKLYKAKRVYRFIRLYCLSGTPVLGFPLFFSIFFFISIHWYFYIESLPSLCQT